MIDKKIRVCVVSPLYHPSLGGLGRQAQLLTENLAERGVEVFVIARRMKGMPPAVFSQKVKIYRAWSFKPYLHTFENVTLTNILVSLTFSVSCACMLFWKRSEYDIAHFHGASFPLVFNLPLLKLFRKKVVAKVASSKLGIEPGSLHGRYFGVGAAMLKLLQQVDNFIATTKEIEDGLKKEGFSAQNIFRIPNSIDVKLFTPVCTEIKNLLKAKRGLENNRIVAFSGRFIQCKGVHILMEAWKDISKDFPDARLLLLGDGPLLDEIKSLAPLLGITDSIIFCGHVSQVIDFLHAADIFVLPSLQEGMPNSLLEAMACGLPVVATRIGGVTDIVKNGENGIVVEPGDPKGLAEGMTRLLRNQEFAGRIAENAFQTIKSFYSIEGILPSYMEIYRQLLGK